MDQMEATGLHGAGLPGAVKVGGTALPLVGRARVYACGITPYDVTHMGHAASFVWIDTLARVLRDAGAEVIICRNVTDVDDVLLAAPTGPARRMTGSPPSRSSTSIVTWPRSESARRPCSRARMPTSAR